MDLAERVTKLKQEIKSMKTSQDTSGDSALLYKVVYNPGPFLVGQYEYRKRVHTITCITECELDRAIFMPVFEGGVSPQVREPDAVSLRDFSNEIIWIQHSVSNDVYNSDPGIRNFVPQGITIYSNVPFVINASVV